MKTRTNPDAPSRGPAKIALDMTLALTIAAAMFAIPTFMINYFYRTLDEPDARDELPAVKAEFAAISAAMGAPRQDQPSISAKGSNVSISATFVPRDGNQFMRTARIAALANHYHEVRQNGATDQTLTLCSDKSIYRWLEVTLQDKRAYMAINVKSRAIKQCAGD